MSLPRTDEFSWGQMTWLAEGADKDVALARMDVRKGALTPAHKHLNCNEVIHVSSGEIEQRRGDEWHRLPTGHTITIFSGEIHQTRNRCASDAVLMIAYSSGAREYQEVAE